MAAGRTDAGPVRAENEDAYAIRADLGLFVVADGMGGQQAGAFAARAVAKLVPIRFGSVGLTRSAGSQGVGKALGMALEAVSADLRGSAAKNPAVRGAGAAVVACAVAGSDAVIAHMGDSRAYLTRNGRLERLTADHTIAALLISLGRLSPSRARRHPGRNVLTRYVGADQGSAGAEVAILALVPGDRILLCTDGLTKAVPARGIAEIVAGEATIDAAADHLIAAANAAGGPDNVTTVLIQYGSAPTPAPTTHRRIVVSRSVGSLVRPIPAEPPGAAVASDGLIDPKVQGSGAVSRRRAGGGRAARPRGRRGLRR